jgi:hypothetical protein
MRLLTPDSCRSWAGVLTDVQSSRASDCACSGSSSSRITGGQSRSASSMSRLRLSALTLGHLPLSLLVKAAFQGSRNTAISLNKRDDRGKTHINFWTRVKKHKIPVAIACPFALSTCISFVPGANHLTDSAQRKQRGRIAQLRVSDATPVS